MDRPTGSSHAAFTMAALVAAGGISGYATRRSMPSLVAGLGIAALFGAGGFQINVSVLPAGGDMHACMIRTCSTFCPHPFKTTSASFIDAIREGGQTSATRCR